MRAVVYRALAVNKEPILIALQTSILAIILIFQVEKQAQEC